MNEDEKYSPTIGKSVTVNFSRANFNSHPVFDKGELIKIVKKKRVWAEIKNVNKDTPSETVLSLVAVYRPAPKSSLLKKSIFSKMKLKIIPITNKN